LFSQPVTNQQTYQTSAAVSDLNKSKRTTIICKYQLLVVQCECVNRKAYKHWCWQYKELDPYKWSCSFGWCLAAGNETKISTAIWAHEARKDFAFA